MKVNNKTYYKVKWEEDYESLTEISCSSCNKTIPKENTLINVQDAVETLKIT